MSMQRHNFFLPSELVDALKEIAKQRKVSMAAVIREALDTFVAERACHTTAKN